MKYLSYIFLFVLLCFIACGKKQALNEDAMSAPDSLLNQQLADAGPSEDEISSLTDTAKQEKKKALDEKYQGLHIYVSKTTMHLYVLDKNDSVLFTCGIACGLRRGNKTAKGDYKTPEGNFHISGLFNSTDWVHKTKDGRSVKGCYGPHFLRLATGSLGGIGIHGTNSPGSIGKRASEGCIRVNSTNIITLYNNYAYNGMPVTVSTEGAPLPAFKGLPNDPVKEKAKEKEKDTTSSAIHRGVEHLQAEPSHSESGDPSSNSSHSQRVAADTLFD